MLTPPAHAAPRERGESAWLETNERHQRAFSHQQGWRSGGCPGANEEALTDVGRGLVLGQTCDYTKSMSTTPSSLTPPAPAQLSSALGTVLDEVLCALETVRVANRTMASDEERLEWIEKVTEAERRVSALKAVLSGEAGDAGSAMRARHTPLRDWLAGSGQESARRAAAAVWKARELEQRPQVRDAATSGRISLEQAAAINEALNGLPTSLDKAQQQHAEDLILVAATHTSPEKLRTMAESLVTQVAPTQAKTPEQRAARLEARDARARARRCLRFGPEADGSIDFSGSLPVLAGRRLQQLVQAIADRAYRTAQATRDRRRLLETPQQRLADALSTLVTVASAVENPVSYT